MKRVLFYQFLLGAIHHLNAQVATTYTISFENAVHHEAFIEATFTDLKSYADIKACMYLVITFYTMMRASSIIFTAEISAITHMFILA